MVAYPAAVYAPRTKDNLPGYPYTPLNKYIGYAEDFTYLENEVLAIIADLVGAGTAGGVKGAYGDLCLRLSNYDGMLNQSVQTGAGPTFDHIHLTTPGNGDAVKGPASATDNAIPRYDSTTGKILQNGQVIVEDNANNTIMNNSSQLVATDFPNATTLYGENLDSASADAVAAAYTGTTFGTDAAFVVRGAELTAAADVLGDATHYCVFGGSAYLESTNATIIAATGTFSTAIWVYQADWTATAADGIVSCTSANMQNGWEMKLTATEDLTVATYSANATAVMTLTANTAGLSAGWHHICWVHTDAASDKIYIDGNLVASAADTTNDYTAGALELCLGASNNHTALLTGQLDEFALHSATALTADQVKQIYARSAKKFAVKDANSNVFIPEPNTSRIINTSYLVTGIKQAAGDITEDSKVNFVVYESGLYDISGMVCTETTTHLANNMDITHAFIKTGSATYASATYRAEALGVACWTTQLAYMAIPISCPPVWLNAGDTVHLGIKVSGAYNTHIYGSNIEDNKLAACPSTYIKAIKIY